MRVMQSSCHYQKLANVFFFTSDVSFLSGIYRYFIDFLGFPMGFRHLVVCCFKTLTLIKYLNFSNINIIMPTCSCLFSRNTKNGYKFYRFPSKSSSAEIRAKWVQNTRHMNEVVSNENRSFV